MLAILIHKWKHIRKSSDNDENQEEEYLNINEWLLYQSYKVSRTLEQPHPVDRFNPHEETTDWLQYSYHLGWYVLFIKYEFWDKESNHETVHGVT